VSAIKKRRSKPVIVRAYCCTVCSHIFHTSRVLLKDERCRKCGGKLMLFDKYKLSKPPKPSGRKKQWVNLGGESKPKGKGKPIFCGSDGEWKVELEQRLQKDDEIVLLALGDVKYEVLAYLNRRKDIEIVKLETRQMKKREKGTGLKAIVKKRSSQALPLKTSNKLRS
jgi:hypothetical protein